MTVSQPHIYIVDDDNAFGTSLKLMLDMKGFSTDYFDSAQSFLDAVPPDRCNAIAIIDLRMPQCDGVTLMQKMQNAGYHMPVIIITGQAQPNTEHTVLQRGAVGFLEKPFSEESLVALLEAAYQNNGKRG